LLLFLFPLKLTEFLSIIVIVFIVIKTKQYAKKLFKKTMHELKEIKVSLQTRLLFTNRKTKQEKKVRRG